MVEKISSSVTVWKTGRLVKVEREHVKISPKVKPGKRRTIRGFTRSSRRRLMRMLSTIDQEANLPVFVTLTYPGSYEGLEAERWKNDLNTFWKRVNRKWPEASCIWKLEPQKRGAPHYHLLVWGVPFRELRSFVPTAWYKIAGNGEENHLLWHCGLLGNSHSVQKINSWGGVQLYASKYISKVTDIELTNLSGWDSPGRFWGVKNRKCLPVSLQEVIFNVGRKQIETFFRIMRKRAGYPARYYQSLSVMTSSPTKWLEVLRL